MFFRSLCILLLGSGLTASRLPAQTTWWINNTTNIGGLTVARNGTPQVTNTLYGNGVIFNGINQGLTLGTNPIVGMTNFTVEMFFRPDPTNTATATQPRMFHIACPNANQIPPDQRLTLEGRITNNFWYADTFIQYSSATASNITLSDATQLHPVGQWYHLAVTYDGAQFKQFVNGVQQLSGAVASGPFTNGVCSIGMRANTNNFFQGVVLALRFTSHVLATNQFLSVPAAVADTFTRSSNASLKITISDLLTNDTDSGSRSLSFAGVSSTTTNGVVLHTDATTIYYTNSLNVPDQFTYTVTNSSGGIATGTVSIQVVAATGTNSVLSLQADVPGPGSNTITLVGISGFKYIVQYASLAAGPWTSLATNIVGSNGVWQVVDPAATNAQRFYRSVAP